MSEQKQENKKTPSEVAHLRKRAEFQAEASELAFSDKFSIEESQRLLHELRVHQIELEVQNEEMLRTQAEIEESRARYFDLYDMAPVGYCTVSEKGVILESNLTAASLLDLNRSVLLNKLFSRFVASEDQDIFFLHRKQFNKDLSTRSEQTSVLKAVELRMLKANGTIFWARLNTLAVKSTGGTFVFRIVLSDITDLKQAEEALALEKERLAITLRSISDGLITTDTQGNVVIMNRVAENLTGWQQSEAQGKPLSTVFQIINNQPGLPCENTAEKVTATTGIIELTNPCHILSRNGTDRVIASSGAPILNKDGISIGVVLVFRDMTERQKLLDILQRTDKLDSLGILAGGIAHDFNNMLAGIFGYIGLALANTTEKMVALDLKKAMTVFSRAKDLTQQLLTFSKGGTPKRQTSDLAPLIMESVSFALSGSKIACDYDIEKDLWLADFDKNQIGQAIDNLVINAQQAMPMGGRIAISAKNVVVKEGENMLLKAGMFIKLSINDTGIGIPPGLLKRIFDPFFTTKQKGHGLGLATCYAILQKHDGCIEVESVMGKGTTFHLFIPASHNENVQSISQASVSHTGSGRILIMDDEPYIREILGRSLKEMGYTILEAKDGEEALQLFAEAATNGAPIDGAFFDLTIPGGMGGKETIVGLRKQYPDMPIYASSGYSEDPVMVRPTEFGFTSSIRKPYRNEELAEMLNRYTPKETSKEKR
ncbi:MAG: PAS domain S-box protein [Candidatus Riflebacteria bacterium]|nr:PAS domain S-box protein [Candidatus Riflebacteria bacterium]